MGSPTPDCHRRPRWFSDRGTHPHAIRKIKSVPSRKGGLTCVSLMRIQLIMAKNAAIYVRVSTLQQSEEGVSMEAQEKQLRVYCEMKGLNVVEVILDPAQSAFKPLAEREGGARLLRLIKGKHVDVVVALKLDRLFRNTVDCLKTVHEWGKRKVSVHFTDIQGSTLDTSTAVGKLFLTMLAAVAEMERNLTSERTKMAFAHKLASADQRITGEAPYGYAYESGILVTDTDEQIVIAAAKALREQGLSYADVAMSLSLKGFRNRAGESFSRQGVFKILKGPKRPVPSADAA